MKVLSRVVQDIKVAGYKFGVYEKRESHKFLKDWSIKIQQYFYNNTNLNITTMDNIGVRMSFVRPTMRVHDKVFRVVREYVFHHNSSVALRDFIDEIDTPDGMILKTLKEKLDKSQEYVLGGFGEQHRDNYHNGYSFSIVFMYPEEIINEHGSIYCPINGIVISKHNRSNIAVNPIHGKDVGFVFDTSNNIELKVKSFQVLCNKPQVTKEKYYFTMGGEVHNVSIVNMQDKDPGIYFMELSKNISTGITEDRLVKYINFNEVSNKNGVFISEYDAMISLNPERSQRERDNQHKERLHELEAMKFEYDMIRAENEKNKAERDRLRIELENNQIKFKIEHQEKEQKLFDLQAEIQSLKHEQEIILLNRTTLIDKIKYDQSIFKLGLEQNVLDSNLVLEREKAIAKREEQLLNHEINKAECRYKIEEIAIKTAERSKDHNFKMLEFEAKQKLLVKQMEFNILNHNNKQQELEREEILNARQTERKAMDENNKNINTLFSLGNTALKLLG